MTHSINTDNGLVFFEYGKPRKAEHLTIVEHLIKKIDKYGMWSTIDEIVKIYTTNYRAELDAHAYKEVQLKNDFGATDDLGSRFLGTIPERLYDTICFLFEDELAQDRKKFMLEFFKRYPAFSVARKL